MLLSDGNLRMNGRHALLSIQQVNHDLTYDLWQKSYDLNLVSNNVKYLDRGPNKKIISYFQTYTLPYFTDL